MNIGLTGGVACGKTEVLKTFADFGFDTLDADDIVHELLPKLSKELIRLFGTTDKLELRKLIFSSPSDKQKIEDLLHPHVWESLNRTLKNRKKEPPVVVCIPLLFETQSEDRFDQTISVLCDEPLQMERLIKRDGISSALAKQMIQSQMPNAQKAKKSDVVIWNNGTLADLKKEVLAIIKKF